MECALSIFLAVIVSDKSNNFNTENQSAQPYTANNQRNKEGEPRIFTKNNYLYMCIPKITQMKKVTFLVTLVCAFQLSAQLSLTSSLVACYALNGNAYEPITNLHGILSNVSPAPNRFNVSNSALYFKGLTSSYVELPNSTLLKPNAISFSAWIKPTQGFSTGGTIVFTGNTSSVNPSAYALKLENMVGGLKLVFEKSNAGSVATLLGSSFLGLNSWHHVCFTADNSALNLYVNGVLQSSVTSTISFTYSNTKKVYLGGTNDPVANAPFTGLIDNARFYNRILSATEVNQLYLSDPSCTTSSLAPVASFSIVGSLCIGQNLVFNDASLNYPDSWQWHISGAQLNDSQAVNPAFTFTNTGSYTVTLVTSNSSGVDTFTSAIHINPLPVLSVVAHPTYMCRGMTTTLTAFGALNYSWSPVVLSQSDSLAFVSPTVHTVYSVWGADANGCTGTATVQVKVITDCWNAIEENSASGVRVLVYPNPGAGKYFLNNLINSIYEYQLCDFSGKLIRAGSEEGLGLSVIDIETYAQGIYFLRITSGERSKSIKLVKE